MVCFEFGSFLLKEKQTKNEVVWSTSFLVHFSLSKKQTELKMNYSSSLEWFIFPKNEPKTNRTILMNLPYDSYDSL